LKSPYFPFINCKLQFSGGVDMGLYTHQLLRCILNRYGFLFVAFTILSAITPNNAYANECTDKTYVHRNIIVLGFPCPQKSAVSIVPTQTGAKKLIDALELLYTQSPQSAAVIETLKKAGPVLIVYDPAYPPEGVHLVTTQIALFLPTFVENIDENATGKQFTVLVGRDGIKWPLKELAAVLVHELMGHGKQHLEDRLDTMRPLDVECEAWLLEEVVYQDLKMDKLSRELVSFRQQLEQIHCSDFIRYMRKMKPEQAKLWDVPNLDVAKLLGIFDGYIEEQKRRGIISNAQEAAEHQKAEAIKNVTRKNDPQELYEIGVLHMAGIGTTPDPAAAATWFRKAAKKGHTKAQIELANLLKDGRGIEQNINLAKKLYVMAAKDGAAEALYALGVMFETGTGVEKDPRKAATFFKEARSGYDLRSFVIFGSLYRQGLGFPQDDKKAYDLFIRSARLGDPWSQFVIGEMHDRGQGVKENPALAIRWWWKAAQQGLAHAQNDLGNHVLNGRGVKKDLKRAFDLFTKAAKQDLPIAQSNLGRLYRLGLGTATDNKAAAHWFRKAAEHGIASSQYELARMLEQGLGIRKNRMQAASWYKKAADQGHAKAQERLKTFSG